MRDAVPSQAERVELSFERALLEEVESLKEEQRRVAQRLRQMAAVVRFGAELLERNPGEPAMVAHGLRGALRMAEDGDSGVEVE